MAEQNEMVKIITPMVEHVCDHLCRFPREISDREELDDICGGCEMGQFLCNILNTYNATDQLQAAAEVVRAEFMKKGDWYNALVVSIHGYFYEMDKPMAPWEVAKGLAERIVGIEPAEQMILEK
ncbi:hypothetical protein [Lacrimispora indolis]|uniref:hypothetical protein n=1 Tax=Lacrimispora indolis TaxID=69825 RepID=UPI00045EB45B|nr:hypothetical protein [Lacrimispora indolis]MBE7718799.1 hypothetical protein [Lacrimispora celerecrescens]